MTKEVSADQKRPYKAPVLKEYGNLHLITRGSSANGNDGAGAMSMNVMGMMGGGGGMMGGGGGMMGGGGGMGMQKFFG